MTEDWAAVGQAISDRLTEQRMTQLELAAKSQVSPATIREIQYNKLPRRRHPRTLEALSEALGWEPGHLIAVLQGASAAMKSVTTNELAAQLDEVRAVLTDVQARLARVEEVRAK